MCGFAVKVAAAVLLSFVVLLHGSDLVHAGGAAEISEASAGNHLMASAKITSSARGDVVGEDPKFPRSKKMTRRLGSRQGPLPRSPIPDGFRSMTAPPSPADQFYHETTALESP